ncbi:MAG: SDR family NAD(P)-dependent oxidoreductase, partial [Dehalococcoidia bacterium]
IAGRFLEMSEERLEELIHSKVLGTVRCSREVVPYMRWQGGGHIINIAGQMGRQPGPQLTGPTSAAVISFTRGASQELAADNIRVTVISPGLIATERLWEARSADQIAQLGSNVPVGHIGEPDDIAAMVVYLASERAGYITGTNIMVDGGQSRAAF